MNSNVAINMHDQFMVRRAGMDALKEKLGSAGAVRFIRQFSGGSGDYTKERSAWLDNLTDDEILDGIRTMDAKRQSAK